MLHNKNLFSFIPVVLFIFVIFFDIKIILGATKDNQVSVVPIFAEKSTARKNECQSGELFFKIGREQLKTGCGIVHCQPNCKCGIFGCPRTSLKKGCKYVVDKTKKSYPDCCPRPSC